MTAHASIVLLLMVAWRPIPRLVWNASESVPISFYLLQPDGKFSVGDSRR
jgi:type IV secretory pathway protease TraF